MPVEEGEFLDLEQFCNFSIRLAMAGSSLGTSEPPRRGVFLYMIDDILKISWLTIFFYKSYSKCLAKWLSSMMLD